MLSTFYDRPQSNPKSNAHITIRNWWLQPLNRALKDPHPKFLEHLTDFSLTNRWMEWMMIYYEADTHSYTWNPWAFFHCNGFWHILIHKIVFKQQTNRKNCGFIAGKDLDKWHVTRPLIHANVDRILNSCKCNRQPKNQWEHLGKNLNVYILLAFEVDLLK